MAFKKLKLIFMVQESIKHFPIPLRKSPKVIAGRNFLDIFIIVILFYVMASWFYNAVSLHLDAYNNIWIYDAEDVVGIDQVIWNTSQGRLFRFNIQAVEGNYIPEDIILTRRNANTLTSHPVVMFAFIALFYLVLSHLSSYIILHALFMSLSGLGLYLIARSILTEKKILPLLVFFIYMCYFPFVNNSHYFHLEEIAIVFIFFGYYFHLKGKLIPTLIFAILAIFCREDNALIFAFLGILSYFRPEKRKHSLPLIFLGIGAFLIIKFVIPKFSVQTDDAFLRHYGYLGQTAIEKLKNIFINPKLIFNNISRLDRLAVFNSVFFPVFYLPLLSPVLFMPGLVVLAQVMLTQVEVMGVLDIYPWYLCGLIPFVFIALTGTFEKLYQIDKLLKKEFPKFCSSKGVYIFTKVISFSLICLLSFYIYTYNSRLSKIDYKRLRDYFAIRQYWHTDTFEALSGIRENTKLAVTCPYILTPILSSREYIMPIRYLTESIVNKGAYDIIILSLSPEVSDFSHHFNFVEKSSLYKKIYYTPYIRIFAKNNTPIIDNWKFDLISKIKDSSLEYNYIISDFTDYSTILENSNAIEPEELVDSVYGNEKIHYDVLEPLKKLSQFQSDYDRITYFVSGKPLETGYSYILAFAAKTEQGSGAVYIRGPEGNLNRDTEVKIDDTLRLYMISFKVGHPLQYCQFLMQLSPGSSVTKPVLFRPPIDNGQGREPILAVNINKHTFSYNPWVRLDSYKSQDTKHQQFLVRYLNNNPMIYFMKVLHFSIPLDLYKYSWVSDCKKGSEVIAVRYSR